MIFRGTLAGMRLFALSSAAVLTLALPGTGEAGERSLLGEEWATFSPCDTSIIDVGDPSFAWALAEGFHGEEVSPDGMAFRWGEKRTLVNVIVSRYGDRQLTLRGHSVAAGMTVSARWNGFDLGERPFATGWDQVIWGIPGSHVKLGANQLEFLASDERRMPNDVRTLAVAFSEIELDEPGGCDSERHLPHGRLQTLPLRMRLGAMVDVALYIPWQAELELSLTGHSGARIEVYSGSGDNRPQLVGEVTHDGVGTVGRVGLKPSGRVPGTVVLVARGPGAVTIERATVIGNTEQSGWRHACGMLGWELGLAVIAVALFVLTARKRTGLPFAKASPWLDVLLIFAIALAVRVLYLSEYWYVDQSRFGDSWEYLRGAKIFNSGETSFWRDTRWHAWQTWIRPPGFYVLLAWVTSTFGWGVHSLGSVHAVFSATTAAATFLVAYPLFGRGAAWVAGILFALNAESLIGVTLIFTEPTYVLLLTCGLAALAWCARRPTLWLALLAGALFGAAALVRSAPVYFVPIAGLLLIVAHGRSALRPAAALVAGMIVVIAPWCVRNSLIYGTVVGIDDIAIINMLQVNPDNRIVPVNDLDLTTKEGFRVYYERLKSANEAGRLTRRGGIIAGGLIRMMAEPEKLIRKTGTNLRTYFQTFQSAHAGHYLGEVRPFRVALWTDALNIGYLFSVVFGIAGMLLTIKDRRVWPLMMWFVFCTAVVNIVFYPDYMQGRFRFATMTVVMAFAGAAVSRLHDRLGRSVRVTGGVEA